MCTGAAHYTMSLPLLHPCGQRRMCPRGVLTTLVGHPHTWAVAADHDSRSGIGELNKRAAPHTKSDSALLDSRLDCSTRDCHTL